MNFPDWLHYKVYFTFLAFEHNTSGQTGLDSLNNHLTENWFSIQSVIPQVKLPFSCFLVSFLFLVNNICLSLVACHSFLSPSRRIFQSVSNHQFKKNKITVSRPTSHRSIHYHRTEFTVSTVLGLYSPHTLLDYIIHSFEMPYSALSLNLAPVVHLCGGGTTAQWPRYSDEPLGEVSGWHQPAGMCNEERIKQDSRA